MKIKITLSKPEQIGDFKEEIERTRLKYSNQLQLNYKQDTKEPKIFIIILHYPSENRIFNWQLFRSIKDQFKKEDKNIVVERMMD